MQYSSSPLCVRSPTPFSSSCYSSSIQKPHNLIKENLKNCKEKSNSSTPPPPLHLLTKKKQQQITIQTPHLICRLLFVFNYPFHSFVCSYNSFNPFSNFFSHLLREFMNSLLVVSANWVDSSFVSRVFSYPPFNLKKKNCEWILLLIKICLLTFALLSESYFHVSNVIYRIMRAFVNKIYHILFSRRRQ